MGNNQVLECRSGCGLNFLSSKDLACTSLQRPSMRKPKSKCHTVINAPSQSNPSCKTHLLKKGKSYEDLGSNTRFKRSNTCHLSLKDLKEKETINENDFRITKILAVCRYGRVCMVKKETQPEMFTMKIICKKKISSQINLDSYLIEKEIMEKAIHPFIPRLLHSFENDKNFFLVREYLEGGQLSQILQQLTRFSEEITKFYSAEVLLALEYLHQRLGVIYNDLKPENVLLDSGGHVKLIDFDLAQKLETKENCLLPTNPSISQISELTQENTSVMTDYWNFGCFVYELLTGKKISQTKIQGSLTNLGKDGLELPPFISKNARDLITRLLHPKTQERLGYNGIKEIKGHAFFAQINWEKILQKTVYPPLNPLQFVKQLQEEEEIESESDNDTIGRCSINLTSEIDEAKENPKTKRAKQICLTERTPREGYLGEELLRG